ncbi:molybdate ABC transporter substrate-binding protein [Jannaschia sp. EhC01]|nr:molybdate ABC transporter substrate-binding protein [Jannaschia sp. EhC01]
MRCVVLSWLLCAVLAVPARAEDVLVFAAASLAGPLDQVAEAFEAETGHSVTISYGGSSTLARQIEAGAPADVVLLANEAWMDHLAARGAIEDASRITLLGNHLVLIGAEPEDLSLEDLADTIGQDRLALALTDSVPAGIYARAALQALGQWEALRPNIVETDNVRAALQLVALGAARYGIVYASDTRIDGRVHVLFLIDDSLHPTIGYPLALVDGAGAEAAAFHAFLQSGTAYATFLLYNFTAPDP